MQACKASYILDQRNKGGIRAERGRWRESEAQGCEHTVESLGVCMGLCVLAVCIEGRRFSLELQSSSLLFGMPCYHNLQNA